MSSVVSPGAAARPAGPEATFTRRSSGLVREVGTLDTFFYGINCIAISYVIFTIAAWFNYPGASMWLSTAITAILGIALCLTYVYLSIVYPRSGGEYVFVSRVVHPLFGFMASVGQAFWQAFYNGFNAAFFAIYGLAPFLTVLGLQYHSDGLVDAGTWVGKKWGIFIIGTVVIIAFAGMLTRGIRSWFKIQRWLIIISMISLGVTVLVLFLGAIGVFDFRSQWNSFAGHGAYGAVIAGGVKAGVSTHHSFSLGQTLNFAVWPAFAIYFTILAVSFGGEIRNVRRSEMVGIPGAMLVGGAIFIILMVLGSAAVGSSFLRAAPAAKNFPSSAPPFLTTFAFVMTGSPVMTVIQGLWTILLAFVLLGNANIYASRAMLAWSLDGMVPRWFGEVSRRHEPARAIILALALGEVALVLFAFTSVLATIGGLLAFVIVFLAVMIAGIMLPYRKPETFEASGANRRIGGVPVIVICGIIGGLTSIFLIWRSLVDNAAGANSSGSIRIVAIVFAVAFVWYFVARWVQRRRGVDMDKRFAEIPVE
jgi:amino acid transporter